MERRQFDIEIWNSLLRLFFFFFFSGKLDCDWKNDEFTKIEAEYSGIKWFLG